MKFFYNEYHQRQHENMMRWQEMETRKSGIKFQQAEKDSIIIEGDFEIINQPQLSSGLNK